MAARPTATRLVVPAALFLCAVAAHSTLDGAQRSAGSGRAVLTATPGGQILHDTGRPTARSVAVYTPPAPSARLVATRRGAADPVAQIKAPLQVLASGCLVDFSDYDALDRLTYAPNGYALYAEDTFTWSPWWFQACNAIDHAVVRPIGYTHFHLNYEDPAIQPCPGSFIDWDIVHENGTCEEFDPREKPRSLSPHDRGADLHLYLYNGYEKRVFGLESIRVRGSYAVRLCYKPLQEDDGAWETSEPDGTTSPGIWLCWDALSPGVWNLSAFAGSVTEVKISASDDAGVFTVDDIVPNL